MRPQTYPKKSASITSVDSGVEFTVKNELTGKSLVNEPMKKEFMDFNENCRFRHKATPMKVECSSDSEDMTSSQFSTLVCSTQQQKKLGSTSLSSNVNKFNIKTNSSSEFEEDILTPKKIKTEPKQRDKGNTKSKRKSINILENHLIQSDLTDELDDVLSVVEVRKHISSYSLCSNVDSEEEIIKSQQKNEVQDSKAVGINKKHKSPDRQKMLKKHRNSYSSSMNSEEGEIHINNYVSYEEGHGITKRISSQNKLTATENDDAKSSQQGCNGSSSDSESSESISCNERHSHPIGRTIRHENPTNFFSEFKDYEKLVPTYADLELDSDDEVYLLKIPKTINPKIMEGTSFSLSKKSKLKLESKKYCIRPQSYTSNLLLTYSNTMRTIRTLATLKMEKHQKFKKPEEIVCAESKKQPLPNGIKIRHPFFGAEYQSKIELEKQIKDKLEQACQRFDLKKKKSRKTVKIEIDNGLTLKKKKKIGEFEVKQEVFSHEEFEPKQVSPKKNQEHNIEPKIKEEIPSNEEFEFNKIPLKKKKKKKKELEKTIEEFSIKTELLADHFPNSAKKRRKSIFSSTVLLENPDISDFKNDVSKIEPEEPAIKKSKDCNDIDSCNENADLINNLLLSAKTKLEYSNNKKKSKRKSS